MINRNFKHLFLGRSLSNIGDSLYSVGLSWFIFSETHSALWVGILNFALFIPNLFSFLLGDFIDKSNKKSLLIMIELGQGILLIPLILLILLNNNPNITATIVVILAFFISTIGMNSYVVQDSMIPELVDEKDFAKSSMYMSFAYNTMDYIGNAIGGILLKLFSVVSILVVDVISFAISAFLFFQIKTIDKPSENSEYSEDKTSIWSGMLLIWNRKDLLLITIFGALGNFFFGGLAVYDVLIGSNLGGSGYYGVLLALESIGVTLGSTFIATFFLKFINLGKLFWISNVGMGIFLLVSLVFENKFVFLFLWGISFVFQGLNRVVINPYLQTTIETKNLAKFFSSFNTLTVTTLPFGSLLFGSLNKYINWKMFIVLFSMFMLLSSLMFIFNKAIYNFKTN